jgi:hypothetical protein
MPATFTLEINSIRTTDVGPMQKVIKHVEFTVKGHYPETEIHFELPQTVTLSDPQSESFLPLEQVTEADVVSWVQSNFSDLDSVKAHIQYVLDIENAKSVLTTTPMPWAPVVEPVVPDAAP